MNHTLLSVRSLHFEHVRGRPVLAGVDLKLAEGEVMVIVGPSGCGKTTLLRAIAGLERPSSGSIMMQDIPLSDDHTFTPPEARGIGFVFQGLALFPHLTVRGNLAFGLHDVPRRERLQRVNDELKAVGLDGLAHRYPHELSGGQQQRVAIARSLVCRPKLLLMDEPFSDLDAQTRATVRTEVLRILRMHGTSAIIVTHDREDAIHVADRIAVMDNGKVVRTDTAGAFRNEWARPDGPFQEA